MENGNYSAEEVTQMLPCVTLSHTAWYIAKQKLGGASIENTKKYWQAQKYAAERNELLMRMVDKVYAASFTDAWTYSTSFFGECAQTLGKMPKDKVGFAGYCWQNAMIALTAQTNKDSGFPAEKTYKLFANLQGDMPKSVIDWVYAGSMKGAEAGPAEWKTCMAPLISSKPGPVNQTDQLEGERLLVAIPHGYKIVSNAETELMILMQMVPQNESVDNWTEMVTSHTVFGLKNQTLEQFQARIQQDWLTVCKGGVSVPVRKGEENGYSFSVWVSTCPLNSSTGKPDVTLFKTIKGNDSLYDVHKAFKFQPSDDQIRQWTLYLKGVVVCDSRIADRACPRVLPGTAPNTPNATPPPAGQVQK
jgi:hypothetical protein